MTLATFALAWWWVDRPLPLMKSSVELSLEAGTTPREVAQRWVDAGVDTSPWLLYQWFRLSGQARKIRAGTYAVDMHTSARALLDKMVQGDESLESVRIIEGWTFRQVRAELARSPSLRPATAGWSDAQIMTALGLAGTPAEGQFFPDTYRFSRGVSDLAVLMPLQTDPTVIYGLGESFDGNLRKRDLLADTPFNTYTRRGLPPTPIAMPGWASLRAAVNPAATSALYFVARGDGSSAFSASLADHNRAVNQYQRKSTKGP
ncbi:MAG: endolytic transglycosylase MltG [Betaproteobacteria bacterium]|nr:endolytic transglycosylase MltG [Betaproteobacteria bacterium]